MYDDVAREMNRSMYLAPELVDAAESDPLLMQAMRNVAEEAEEAENAVEARKAAAPQKPKAHERTFHPDSTPEFRAHLVEIVTILGRRYVAAIGGAGRTGELGDWMHGISVPIPDNRARLELTFRLVQQLRHRSDDKGVAHWFLTRNEALGGQMPLTLLVIEPAATSEKRLVAAAQA